MPTMIQTVSGRVSGLWGKAVIRGADGKMRPLKMGDYVVKGDMILTSQDGIVQLTPEAAPPRVAELEIEPPGAGAGAGSLLEGLRIGRVAEGTSPLEFSPLPVEERARIASERDSNLPPYGNPFAVTTPEDVPVAVPLRGFDSDGRVVSVILTRVPPTGQLFLGSAVSLAKDAQAATGTAQATPKVVAVGEPLSAGTVLTAEEAANLLFLPTPNFKGNPGGITFVLVDDKGARSSPIDVTISVIEVNDPPVAGTVPKEPGSDIPVSDPDPNHLPGTPNYKVTTPEDTPIPGQVRATDVDLDVLTYAKTSDPSNGKVTVNPDGTWLYTPNKDYNGPDQFKVTVSDGRGGTDTSTVFIDVTPVDDSLPPAGADAVRTTPEDTPYIVQANDFGFSDPNPGDKLAAVRIDSLPARGSLTLDGVPVTVGQLIPVAAIDAGKLSFIAAPDDTGNDYASFRFSVQDNTGAFDPSPNNFSFNVTPVNDTPVAGDDRAITPEDTPIKIDVLANDSDADPGDTLRIIQVNGSPVSVGSAPVPVSVAGVVVGTVTLSPDQQLVFTPVPNYVGPANFDYTITDGLTPVKGQVRVDVTPVNDPPVANPDNVNTLQGTPVNIPVRQNDTDVENDPLTVTAVTQGTRGTVTIDPGTGNPVYTPNPGTNGPDRFTYTITDGNGGSSTTTVTVNVGAVNQAPAALPDTGSTNEDTVLVRSAAQGVILGAPGIDSDPDGNSLTVTRVALGASSVAAGAPLAGAFGVLTLNADGSYAYAPSAAAQALKADESRTEVFTYTVADPSGLSATTTLTITVTGVNDGPVAVNDRASTPEDTPVTIRVLGNDSDPEGDALTVTQVDGKPITVGSPVALTDPVKNLPIGSVALNTDGTLTFTPVTGYNGTPSFTYTITDGQLTSTATVNLIVDSVNDPPVANPDLISGLANTLISFDPRANDTDPDTPKEQLAIVQINGSPIVLGTPVQLVEGELNLKPDGTLSFTPKQDFSGVVNFDYTLSDGALTDVSQVRITIVDDRPAVQAINNPITVEGGNLDFNITLSNTSTLTTSLTLKLADGTATLGSDTSAPLVSVDRGQTFTAATVRADGSIVLALPGGTPTDAVVLRVPTVVDNLTEDRETLTLTASTPKNGAPVTGVGSIDDGNGLAAVSITGPVTIDEAAGTATYTVTLSNPSTKPVTVAYATADGTATAGADYTATSGTLTFAPNELSKTVTVSILNDNIYEVSENFRVNLSAPTNANLGNGSVLSNIVDDGSGPPTAPPPASPPGTPPTPPDNDKPVASITGPVTIDEAAGTATYTVTLSNPSDKPVTIAFATADGTATAGTDYTATSGTLTFAARELTKTVTVPILNDNVYEVSESFRIDLSAPTNATIGTGSVLSNIVDDGSGPPTAPPPGSPPGTPPTPPDNDKPVASITGPVTIDEASGTATYTVTLSNPSDKPVTIAFATADGTATAGTDYTATSGTLTFAARELTKTVTVPILNDNVYEVSESFRIDLSAPTNATIGTGSVLSNIVDDGSGPPTAPPPGSPPGTPPTPPDNDKPVASITGPVTIDEASGTATYTVTLTNPATKLITIAYATADGTATAGTDYTATSGTLNFAAGELTKTITVPILNDRIYEVSENFSIALSAPTNATIGTGSVLSNIVDDGSGPPTAPPPGSPPGTPPTPPDNDKPVASITGPVTIDEASGTATYTVTLSNPSDKPVTIAFATADGTATAGTDYTATSGTLTFAARELTKTVTVPILNDRIYEVSENFSIALSAPTNATIGTGSVLSNIVDDGSGPPTAPPPGSPPGTPPTPPDNDKPVASITGPVTIDEAAGTATYTVTLSNPSDKPVTIAFATADGTATAGTDYTATSGTLTFAARELTKTVTVPILNDNVYEVSESFRIDLSAPTNATIGTGSVLSNIVDDGSGPPPPPPPPGTPPTPPDNDKPIVAIDVAPASVAEDGTANLVYTISLSNGKTSVFDTTVNFTLSGTASEGSDYAAVTRTVVIPAGQSAVTVTVDPTADSFFERNETVVATLTSAITGTTTLQLSATASSATGTIVDNDRPTQGAVPTAQESALPTGTNPALTTEVVTGKMAGTDTTNPNFSWTLGAPAAGVIKSGGQNVVWSVSADSKTVLGSVTETANGVPTVKTVATLTISNTGDYTFTLLAPIDHPAGGTSTQVLPIDFTATASTGGADAVTAPVTLSINVQDDQPGTVVPPSDLTSTIANTNLMFVLDLSYSMREASGITGLSRLQAAVDSIQRLIDKYDALGETTVRLVTFETGAQAQGARFFNLGVDADKTELTRLLTQIRATDFTNLQQNFTNYDAALIAGQAAWAADGKIAGAQNVSYFLSDGIPSAYTTAAGVNTRDNGYQSTTTRNADTGIQAAEETTWTTFLTSNNVVSYAIGVGIPPATGTTPDGFAELAPVAYDGQAQENRNAVLISDFTQLDSVLAKTLPAPISGNLVGSLNTGAAGADGGIFVKSVVIADVSYEFTRAANGVGGTLAGFLPLGSSFDAATGTLTVNSTLTTGARFVVDFDDGTYRFETPQKTGTESIAYTLSDRDGDVTPSATLQILVDTPAAAVNGDGNANPLTGDARFNTLYGNGGDDNLQGLGGNDKLFGNAGNDQLNGGDGNDELSGGAGTDTLIGGNGNDFLAGGAGNDNLSGGAGSDVFAWRFADQGTGGAGRALDTITDFDVKPVTQGGDVLDLRDLLSGEAKGATDTVGNLLNYLEIDTTSSPGNTEIRISTSGGFAGGAYAAGSEDQRITLSNVNLSTALVPGQTLTETQIIENLLKNGKLITD